MYKFQNGPSTFERGLSFFTGSVEMGAGVACKAATISGVGTLGASILVLNPGTPLIAIIALFTVYNAWELGSELIEKGDEDINYGLNPEYGWPKGN